jgi:hypothetical protein
MKRLHWRATATTCLDGVFAITVLTTIIGVVSIPSYVGSTWHNMSVFAFVLTAMVFAFGVAAALFQWLRIYHRTVAGDLLTELLPDGRRLLAFPGWFEAVEDVLRRHLSQAHVLRFQVQEFNLPPGALQWGEVQGRVAQVEGFLRELR